METTPPPIPSAPPALSAEPPPLPPPPRFRLHFSVWIAWGAYSLLATVVVLARGGGVSGSLFAGLGLALALPAFVAWLAWRIGGRSGTAGTVGFFVMLGLLTAVQVAWPLVKRVQNRVAAQHTITVMRADQQRYVEEQRQALKEGRELNPAAGTQMAERTASRLRELAEKATGDERDVLEAAQTFSDRAVEATRRYEFAAKSMDSRVIVELDGLNVPGKTAAHRRGRAGFCRGQRGTAGCPA